MYKFGWGFPNHYGAHCVLMMELWWSDPNDPNNVEPSKLFKRLSKYSEAYPQLIIEQVQ